MAIPRLLVLACATMLGIVAQVSLAAEPYSRLLTRAEQMRSADPRGFATVLAELESRQAEATGHETRRLRYLKAYQQAYSGRYDLAIESASALFEATEDVDLQVRAGALIVNSRAATREFTEGLIFLDKVLALVPRARDPEARHHGWSAAGVIYNQVGQHDLARHYAELMLADGVEGRTACFADTLRLEALGYLDQRPDDPGVVQAAIDRCLASGEKMLANFGRLQMAHLLADRDERPAAIALLRDHLAEMEATRYPRLLGEVHSLLAQLELAESDLAAAEHHAAKAIENSAGIAFSMPLVLAHQVLYETARARGDDADALEQYRLYAEADRAYLNTVKARELAFQMAKHETLQKNQMIDQLHSQNRVLQLEQKVSQQQTRNVQLLLVLLAVLLASLGLWGYRTKRTQVVFRRLAEVDGLTGVSNRHHFSRRAAAALDACRKNGEDVAMVMFDLDRFKAINDQYGHAIGDWVLTEVAAHCRGVIRKNDLFGRLGGEEFAFLLVGADHVAAAELAQACRARLHRIDTADTGRQFTISASFGIATAKSAGYDLHTLMARADAAMYRAKNAGRDRVEQFAEAT